MNVVEKLDFSIHGLIFFLRNKLDLMSWDLQSCNI